MLFHLSRRIGRGLARFLNQPTGDYEQFSVTPSEKLRAILEPGDILLIEGKTRISTAIKYFTQSTWSHSALYIGDAASSGEGDDGANVVEADLVHGVVAAPLSKYERYNTRVCRPVGLSDADRKRIVTFMCRHIGYQYDLKNVFDLLRYFFPLPPVPVRYRRRFLAIGSGDPTKAICSTLIAQAFHQIGYPILPRRSDYDVGTTDIEALEMRHYSHFVPRDFDLSPYFRVVKPTLVLGFDYHNVVWKDRGTAHLPRKS